MFMRDEEGRKKEASKVKQTTRQSNTAHPRQSLFLRNELPRMGLEPTTLHTLDRALYQLRYMDVWGELASHKRSLTHRPSSQGWASRCP